MKSYSIAPWPDISLGWIFDLYFKKPIFMFEGVKDLSTLQKFLPPLCSELETIEEIIDLKKLLTNVGIPKKRGWYRSVWVNKYSEQYALVDEKIREEIESSVNFPQCVYWIKWKSIVENAQNHLHSKMILNVDIKWFFDSIWKELIYQSFFEEWVSQYMASFLADFVTIDNKLITWLSCSPIISNLIFTSIDQEILKLCDPQNIVYTRYADDLVFSWIEFVKKDQVDLFFGIIQQILYQRWFTTNKSKSKKFTSKYGQYVTWLIVNDRIRPRVGKKLKKRFRQETYYIKKYGLESHMEFSKWKNKFCKKWTFSYLGRERLIYWVEGRTFIESIERMVRNYT